MTEESRSLAQKFVNRMMEVKSSLSPNIIDSESFTQLLDEIIVKAFELGAEVQHEGVLSDAPDLKAAMFYELHKNTSYTKLKLLIVTLYNRDKIHQDEHKTLARIENSQAMRRLFWRIVTTVSVSAVIFGFYWLAHSLGVPLPLSRMPV